jgi:hypothetical protein
MQNLTEFLHSLPIETVRKTKSSVTAKSNLFLWDGPLPRTNGYFAMIRSFAIFGTGIVRQVLTDITKKASLIEMDLNRFVVGKKT